MTTLVAGCAALYDLIAVSDSSPEPPAVGLLSDGPGAQGRWLPGGTAMTVALALASCGQNVRLWHPLPTSVEDDPTLALISAGLDLSCCPRSETAAYCVLIRTHDEAYAWSSVPALVDQSVPRKVLQGVKHVVICPAWGDWTVSLLAAAVEAGVPCSLVGMLPPAAYEWTWRTVVISEGQIRAEMLPSLRADLLALTRGRAGSRLRTRAGWQSVEAVPAHVVDPTGAGDVYAGTLIATLDAAQDPSEAARVASHAAARCCESWGAHTSLHPRPVERPTRQDSRGRGALWGLACGDAFGMPTAFVSRTDKRRWRGEGDIVDLVAAHPENPYHAGYPAGRVTDDTEQAMAVTRALMASRGALQADTVARELDAWLARVGGPDALAVGPSTRKGLLAWRAGVDVGQSGRGGTSNGGAMRIAPVGIVHGLRHSPIEELLRDVAAACLPTHNSTVAISGAAAVAGAIAAGITGSTWHDVLAAGQRCAEAGRAYGAWVYAPDVARRIALALQLASRAQSDAACCAAMSDIVGAGEPTAEAVPAAFGLAARAKGDPRHAIQLAGNMEGDSDTVAAMAGAICGAWAGDDAIPEAWRSLVAAVNGLDVPDWFAQLDTLARTHRVPGEGL